MFNFIEDPCSPDKSGQGMRSLLQFKFKADEDLALTVARKRLRSGASCSRMNALSIFSPA
jgi:hypothetical protein